MLQPCSISCCRFCVDNRPQDGKYFIQTLVKVRNLSQFWQSDTVLFLQIIRQTDTDFLLMMLTNWFNHCHKYGQFRGMQTQTLCSNNPSSENLWRMREYIWYHPFVKNLKYRSKRLNQTVLFLLFESKVWLFFLSRSVACHSIGDPVTRDHCLLFNISVYSAEPLHLWSSVLECCISISSEEMYQSTYLSVNQWIRKSVLKCFSVLQYIISRFLSTPAVQHFNSPAVQ